MLSEQGKNTLKIPKTPKPKLPRPKKTLGQHIKSATKKAVSQSLTKNFGVLGSAISKRYIAPPPSASKVRANNGVKTPNDKDIKKKPIKTTSSSTDSIMESAKQVSAAVDVVAGNATRHFATASRQADIMGENVTGALNDLAGLLDKLLYQSRATSTGGGSGSTGGGGGTSPPTVTDPDDDSPSSLLTRVRTRGRNPNKTKPRTRERFGKAKARLDRMKGVKAAPTSRFGKFGKLGRGLGPLNVIMSGADAYSEYSQTGNLGRASAGFAGDLTGAALGALIGTFLFPGLGTIGGALVGMAFGSAGAFVGKKAAQKGYDAVTAVSENKVTVGGDNKVIEKMTYRVMGKLTFKAKNSIEFKIKSAMVSGGGAGNPTTKKKPYAGFFNGLADKMLGSSGEGSLNSAASAMQGGPGGQGFFNNLANKIFGLPGAGRTGTNTDDPSGTPTGTPSISKSDAQAEPTGSYDSRTARANFMQPGSEYGAPGQNITSVTTEGGHKFQIHSASAEAFKRTIEDLEKAGAPIGSIGGYSPRPGGIAGSGKMSQHAMGNAMDIGSQSARNVISPKTREWIESHPNEWRNILNRNGMISGGDWKNPDLGHIEWSGRKPWLDNQQTNKAEPQPAIKDFGLPKEGRTLSGMETFGLKTQYSDDYNKLPADVKAKVDAGQPITNEDVGKINPDSQQKLREAGVIKYADIPPELNKQFASRPTDRSWTGWEDFRRSKNIEDNRSDPNPLEDDEYSQATNENEAHNREKTSRADLIRQGEDVKPSSLGYALGGRDLVASEKPISTGGQMQQNDNLNEWDKFKPVDKPEPQVSYGEPPTKASGSSQTKYQQTGSTDLDHSRLGKDGSQSFTDYQDVSSN